MTGDGVHRVRGTQLKELFFAATMFLGCLSSDDPRMGELDLTGLQHLQRCGQPMVDQVVSYDARQIAAAEALGIATALPGTRSSD